MSISTTQSMLSELIKIHGCSAAHIAHEAGISSKTVQRLLAGITKPSIKTENNLFQFYWFYIHAADSKHEKKTETPKKEQEITQEEKDHIQQRYVYEVSQLQWLLDVYAHTGIERYWEDAKKQKLICEELQRLTLK